MSRRNARYRPGISLARSGVRRVCRRTNGCSNIGLMRRMDYCATVGFACRNCMRLRLCRSKPLHEGLYASACITPGAWRDSSKLLGSSERGQPSICAVLAPARFESNRPRMFRFYKSTHPNPLVYELPRVSGRRSGACQNALRMQERAACLLGRWRRSSIEARCGRG